VMSRRYQLPVYANEGTASCLESVFAIDYFETGKTFSLGSATIQPFSIVHDARDPVAFTIHHQGLILAHLTDLGRVTPVIRDRINSAHALVLEFNYEPHLLQSCGYPWQVKQRIASTHGHLSNQDAAKLLSESWHV